jgi:hypothetical protein
VRVSIAYLEPNKALESLLVGMGSADTMSAVDRETVGKRPSSVWSIERACPWVWMISGRGWIEESRCEIGGVGAAGA